MPGHRSLTWIVPPLLIAAALPTVAWSAGTSALERPTFRAASIGQPWSARGSDGPARAVSSLPACSGPDGAGVAASPGTAAASSGVADPPRYRLSGVLARDGDLRGWELSVTSAGPPLRLALPPESAVRGPLNGWLSVASDDGARSEVRLVSTGAGCGRLVHSSSDVVRQAVITADGSVLFHAVGRTDRADRGIWRTGFAGIARLAPVLPPLAGTDPVLEAVGLVWATELRTSLDGHLAAAESCGAHDCRIRVASLRPGGDMKRSTHAGRLVGLDDRQIVSLRSCDGAACVLVASQLDGGTDRTLATAVTSATPVMVDGALLVAATTVGAGAPALLVIDPATGWTWTSRQHPGGGPAASEVLEDLRLVPPGGTVDAGAEMPAGWAAGMAGPALRLVPIDAAAIVAAARPEVGQ